MTEFINRKFVLAKRPLGQPDESDFALIEAPMRTIKNGEALVKIEFISVDPYMRGRMSVRKSYIKPYRINEVIMGSSVGKVIQSRSSYFIEGDYVEAQMGWQEYCIINDSCARKIDPAKAPVSTALGVLGMTGLTAYFGLLDIGNPKPGETVVISGAAGAVGCVVGQIAKIFNCYTVGIAGSDEKVDYLVNNIGFDVAINYKKTKHIRIDIRRACPKGVDVYFDNVGGDISDAVISLINDDARIAICGQINQYNLLEIPRGPRIQGVLLTHTALMKGFLVFKFAERFNEAFEKLTQWYIEGKLKNDETIVQGFENTPKAFLGLFTGRNIGKLIVKV